MQLLIRVLVDVNIGVMTGQLLYTVMMIRLSMLEYCINPQKKKTLDSKDNSSKNNIIITIKGE